MKAEKQSAGGGLSYRNIHGATVSLSNTTDVHSLLGVRIEQLRWLTALICESAVNSYETDKETLQNMTLLANELVLDVEELYDLDDTESEGAK